MDRTLSKKLIKKCLIKNINDILKTFFNRFGMCSGCCNKRIKDCLGGTR